MIIKKWNRFLSALHPLSPHLIVRLWCSVMARGQLLVISCFYVQSHHFYSFPTICLNCADVSLEHFTGIIWFTQRQHQLLQWLSDPIFSICQASDPPSWLSEHPFMLTWLLTGRRAAQSPDDPNPDHSAASLPVFKHWSGQSSDSFSLQKLSPPSGHLQSVCQCLGNISCIFHSHKKKHLQEISLPLINSQKSTLTWTNMRIWVWTDTWQLCRLQTV